MDDNKIAARDILKIPNLITCFRIFLALAILFILLADRYSGWIKWIFLICVISDKLDGILARRFNQASRLGVVLEPIADTLLVFFTVLFVTFRMDLHRYIFFVYLAIFFIGFFNLLAIYLAQGRWFAKKLEISEVSIFFIYATGIFYLFNLPYKFYLALISIGFGFVALADFLWQLHQFRKTIKKPQ